MGRGFRSLVGGYLPARKVGGIGRGFRSLVGIESRGTEGPESRGTEGLESRVTEVLASRGTAGLVETGVPILTASGQLNGIVQRRRKLNYESLGIENDILRVRAATLSSPPHRLIIKTFSYRRPSLPSLRQRQAVWPLDLNVLMDFQEYILHRFLMLSRQHAVSYTLMCSQLSRSFGDSLLVSLCLLNTYLDQARASFYGEKIVTSRELISRSFDTARRVLQENKSLLIEIQYSAVGAVI